MHVYDRLVAAGAAVGLRHAGLKALASLRMEKGYRDYGHDIDNTDSVLEAGLGLRGRAGQAGRLHRPGRGAGAEGARAADPPAGAGAASTDPEPLMFHAEVVRRDGVPVGYIRAASYGHTLGGAVGLAMVDGRRRRRSTSPGWTVASGRSRSAAACTRRVASLRPLYDPKNERIRA